MDFGPVLIGGACRTAFPAWHLPERIAAECRPAQHPQIGLCATGYFALGSVWGICMHVAACRAGQAAAVGACVKGQGFGGSVQGRADVAACALLRMFCQGL